MVAVYDKMQAKCNLWKVTFSLGKMGTQALKSHATGKGHCKKLKECKEIHSFFTKRQSVSKSSEKEKNVE